MKVLRAILLSLLFCAGAAGFVLGFFYWCQLPNHDYSLIVPDHDPAGEALKARLATHVKALAGDIGHRNLNRAPQALASAAGYITAAMELRGFTVARHTYSIGDQVAENLYATIGGPASADLLVIGAHYDSFDFSPGADDNASGVAMLIELAAKLKERRPVQPMMFVFFTCEEEPYYETSDMGSRRFVHEVLEKQQRNYRMINLESVGYFTRQPESQYYPFPLDLIYYPVGDFIGFVSDMGSRGFMKKLVFGFRENSNFPTGASSLPALLPGVDWSDHAAFWRAGKKAVMVTDSALFRNPFYHTRNDRPELLDYTAMAHVTNGLEAAILDLIN